MIPLRQYLVHENDVPAATAAAVHQASDEQLIAELARRGRWVIGDLDVLAEVRAERTRQDQKWGPDRDLPHALNQHSVSQMRAELAMPGARRAQDYVEQLAADGELYWLAILIEEVAEAVEAGRDPVELRRELVQVAAVAVAEIECIDRNGRT